LTPLRAFMAGLVPGIPLRRALCLPKRDAQDKPAHDRLVYVKRTGARMTDRPESPVDPKLLEILVCPLTKATLEYDAARQELISRSAKLAYPIRDGIPIMLPEEARRLD
jgi:uncharacterized protein YbaR (Trm112 family)